jgi:glycosyltransferase involved in cell wall biosynthesis
VTGLAIAHEWLAERAGSEKVFEAMAEAFPGADLFVLTREPGVPFDFGGRRVRTTFLDRSAFLRRRRDLTLPLMPLAWSLVRPRAEYERVLTSSHACVRAFPPARRAEHFCYVHAPMRYVWDVGIDARAAGAGAMKGIALRALRRWDLRSTRTVDHFAVNSTAVRERVRRLYSRDARVIFPPVDTEFFTPAASDRRGVLAVSRFTPYKRLDLAIDACALAGMPLTVAGSGAQEADLRSRARAAGADVHFEISPSDERLRELYRTSEMLLFPANEDFGIVPVEAQACGTPVVAIDLGGARDTVVQGRTGLLAERQDERLLADALLELHAAGLDGDACRHNAERFSRTRFRAEITAWLSGR